MDLLSSEPGATNEVIINHEGSFVVVIRGWLNKKSATLLYEKLIKTIPWEQRTINMIGKPVLEPRMTYFMGDNLSVTHNYARTSFELNPWTEECKIIKDRVIRETGVIFDSGLLNRYDTGDDYIGYHPDHEAVGKHRAVASLSLGGSRDFYYKHNKTGQVVKTTLHNGDGLLMWGNTNIDWKHSIPKRAKADGRISLTLRELVG